MIKNKIELFKWICMDEITCVDLNAGKYRTEFFQKYDDFETYRGNGYDWELFAESHSHTAKPPALPVVWLNPSGAFFGTAYRRCLSNPFFGAAYRQYFTNLWYLAAS